MKMALEAVILPVADIDRAKSFYERVGFACDVDHDTDDFRVVQFTPPGSACSVLFGRGLGGVSASPVVGLHLVVTDLSAAHDDLTRRGIEAGEPFHFGSEGKTPGIDPERRDYSSYVQFADPDGNTWLLQEVPSRSG